MISLIVFFSASSFSCWKGFSYSFLLVKIQKQYNLSPEASEKYLWKILPVLYFIYGTGNLIFYNNFISIVNYIPNSEIIFSRLFLISNKSTNFTFTVTLSCEWNSIILWAEIFSVKGKIKVTFSAEYFSDMCTSDTYQPEIFHNLALRQITLSILYPLYIVPRILSRTARSGFIKNFLFGSSNRRYVLSWAETQYSEIPSTFRNCANHSIIRFTCTRRSIQNCIFTYICFCIIFITDMYIRFIRRNHFLYLIIYRFHL